MIMSPRPRDIFVLGTNKSCVGIYISCGKVDTGYKKEHEREFQKADPTPSPHGPLLREGELVGVDTDIQWRKDQT